MKRIFFNAFLATALLLLLWQVSSICLNKAFLPSVGQTFEVMVSEWQKGSLLNQTLISTKRILSGLFWAIVLSIPLGLAMGRIKILDEIISPLIYLLYPLPKVVFLPIIVVIMGLGDAPKIFLIALVVFFQILVSSRDAAKNIPGEYLENMRSMHANLGQRLRHLILPYCLSDILTALRITLGTSIAILFFAETFASVDGLGYFILNGMESRNYPKMYAGICAMAILGLILYAVIDAAERFFCRWKKY